MLSVLNRPPPPPHTHSCGLPTQGAPFLAMPPASQAVNAEALSATPCHAAMIAARALLMRPCPSCLPRVRACVRRFSWAATALLTGVAPRLAAPGADLQLLGANLGSVASADLLWQQPWVSERSCACCMARHCGTGMPNARGAMSHTDAPEWRT